MDWVQITGNAEPDYSIR